MPTAWHNKILGAPILCLLIGATSALAADWPQFMGPDGNGVSSEKGLARAWPDGGPHVLWRTTLGAGYGGAAIRGGKVYQ